MKKVCFLLLCVCFSSEVLFSQTHEEKRAGFQLSFVPPLSTQGTQAIHYNNAVSINILAGVSKRVSVLSFSGLGMYVKEDLSGFHLSGLGTYAGGDGGGVMLSGLFNGISDYNGFQLAGLVNKAKVMNGIQLAGLTNLRRGDTQGFQLGGLVNIASGYNGVQLGGLVNIVSDLKGFQLAGLVNRANDVTGFQIAGLVNKARRVKGAQLAGLVNIAEKSDYPIGLINIIKEGEMSVGATYNEIGSSVLAFRSGGRILYGIIGVGYNHKMKEDHLVVEAGLGAHIPISSRFRINNELRVQNMTDFSNEDQLWYSSMAIMPAFKIFPCLELYGGPSVNYMQTENSDYGYMFPDHSFWKGKSDKRQEQRFFGFNVGIHFLF